MPFKTVCIVLNETTLCSVQWMHSVACNAVCIAIQCAFQYSVHCIGVCSFKQVWQCKRNLFQVNGNLLAKNSIPSKARITRFLCSKHNFSIIFDNGFLSLFLKKIIFQKLALYFIGLQYILGALQDPQPMFYQTQQWPTFAFTFHCISLDWSHSCACILFQTNTQLNIFHSIADAKNRISCSCMCECVWVCMGILCVCVRVCMCVYMIV